MAMRTLRGKDPDYEFISSLMGGGQGTVAKVRRLKDGQVMACKVIDCTPHPTLLIDMGSREAETWAAFAASEKYIAEFSGDCAWNERTKTMRLYMKFYEGGDLQRVIDQCRHEDTTIHPFIATYWAMELARGMKACHDHGIIHRDLKPANVLLTIPYAYNDMLWAVTEGEALDDGQKELAEEFSIWLEERTPWCHITDFGLGKFSAAALHQGRNTMASMVGGTQGYMPPETLGNEANYSIKSDIYSLGMLLYCLCTCRPPPYAGFMISDIPDEYPKALKDLITRCLNTDPDKRPSNRELTNATADAFINITESKKYGLLTAKLSAASSGISIDPISRLTSSLKDVNLYKGESEQQLNHLLRDAVYREDAKAVEQLIDAGAYVDTKWLEDKDVQTRFLPHEPYSPEGLAKAKTVYRTGERAYTFISQRLVDYCIMTGSIKCFTVLMSRKADCSSHQPYSRPHSLALAAYHNQAKMVEMFIKDYGYSPDTYCSSFKKTPLAIACSSPNLCVETIHVLLLNHALPTRKLSTDHKSGHWYLFDFVRRHCHFGDIKRVLAGMTYLIHASPELINIYDEAWDKTICHIAAYHGARTEILRLLINNGADPNLKNKARQTAFEIEFESGIKVWTHTSVKVAIAAYQSQPAR